MGTKGYKSTEFYLSLAAMLIGAVMASGILDVIEGSTDDRIVGLIASVLAALGYTVSRTIFKRGKLVDDTLQDGIAHGMDVANPTRPRPPTG